MDSLTLLGAMSGTSADGVDVAAVRVAGRLPDVRVELLAHAHTPYTPDTAAAIQTIRAQGVAPLSTLASVGRGLTLTYAAAVRATLIAAKLDPSHVAAVACHGQTLFHAPPDTIQWFDPSLLAYHVGIPVVSDFRRADLAAGGQGAPLVPFADFILFRHPTRDRVLLNLGGIANVTILPAGCAIEQVTALDTGPGNCVSDHLCRTLEPAGPGYDASGQLAQKGQVDERAVNAILREPYFTAAAPKSTDGPAMVAAFTKHVDAGMPLADQLATSATVAARAIGHAVRAAFPNGPHDLLVAGGGTQNAALMRAIRAELPATTHIDTTAAAGIPPQAREAVAFALLGAATLQGYPGNVPSATGAERAVVLGSITPRP
jgi:anhydro-N-acetylmuramic acid kinase